MLPETQINNHWRGTVTRSFLRQAGMEKVRMVFSGEKANVTEMRNYHEPDLGACFAVTAA